MGYLLIGSSYLQRVIRVLCRDRKQGLTVGSVIALC